MSSRDVIERCCGRTRVNVCTACRRVFEQQPSAPQPMLTGVPPGPSLGPPLPRGIRADELAEFRAFQAGLRWGVAIGFVLSGAAAFLAVALGALSR